MKHINYPSITQFQQLVELKDFRKPTKKEYVRYVRKLAEHVDVATTQIYTHVMNRPGLGIRSPLVLWGVSSVT